MINSNKKIYVTECEIKPNRYASIIEVLALIGIIGCWIMNEIGLFRVGKTEMRIGTLIPLVAMIIPLMFFLVNRDSYADPRMKYLIVTVGEIYSLAVNTLLSAHTVLMLLFPLFLAMLYRSKALGKLAIIYSVATTITAPVLSYVLGLWEEEYFKEMLLIMTNGTAEIIGATPGISMISIAKIVLYLVIPRLIIVISCCILLIYVIGIGQDHVENQILLNKLSHNDVLTGLYNQNYYKEILKSDEIKGTIGVIFFDVNNLKASNDAYGHEYGDLLLKRSAQSIANICTEDNVNGFRIGGDEFLIFVENENEDFIKEKVRQWEESLKKINEENVHLYNGVVCSMADGYALGDASDLEEIIRKADNRMYDKKREMKAIHHE